MSTRVQDGSAAEAGADGKDGGSARVVRAWLDILVPDQLGNSSRTLRVGRDFSIGPAAGRNLAERAEPVHEE